tara:strand:- start:90 stop:272 length:183 start_codon:yes stop_codon:yes gene_type:complete
MNSEKEKIEGLGDIIKRLTGIVGVKPCSKCEERRKKMNEMFPFKKDHDSVKNHDPKKPSN